MMYRFERNCRKLGILSLYFYKYVVHTCWYSAKSNCTTFFLTREVLTIIEPNELMWPYLASTLTLITSPITRSHAEGVPPRRAVVRAQLFAIDGQRPVRQMHGGNKTCILKCCVVVALVASPGVRSMCPNRCSGRGDCNPFGR